MAFSALDSSVGLAGGLVVGLESRSSGTLAPTASLEVECVDSQGVYSQCLDGFTSSLIPMLPAYVQR